MLAAFERAGYPICGGTDAKTRPFDLNIFGIRTRTFQPDVFDDLLGCLYRDASGSWRLEMWKATTDPGLYYLRNPAGKLGTAILKPGRYQGLWEIGLHKGKIAALVQRAPCTVYRDADRDSALDLAATETGCFGINCHPAKRIGETLAVGMWSAGCQVTAETRAHARIMQLAQCQKSRGYGDRFSYTLFDEADIEGAAASLARARA